MSQCPDLCGEWVRETEGRRREPTEVGPDFGGRCFCCHGAARYQVWRFRGSEPERGFFRRDCYVRSGLFMWWLGLETSAAAAMRERGPTVFYELGWATLPGLRGLSVSEFRAAPTANPDNERGVAVEFASEQERDAFLRLIEAEFETRRFTNTAEAFDTVKAYAVEYAAKR
jgi:hypothetical protein